MPNPNDFISEDQVTQMESAGLWAPANQEFTKPQLASRVPPPQTDIDNYGGIPLPANLGLQPDLTKTITPYSTAPIRLMPIIQNAASNAASKSIAVDVVTKAIAAIPAAPTPPSGYTPNLAIGDTFVNWPQSDPASVILVDDFLYSGSNFGTPGTSGTIGQLGWLAFSTGGTLGNYPSPAPHLGSIQIETNTSVNSGNTFVLAQEGITGSILSGIPITTMVGWEAHFVFKWPSFVAGSFPNATAKTRMYLGFGQPQNASTTFARPTKFLGLRFDTDTTSPSIADTTYHYEFVQNGSVTNTQGTVVNSGIAPDFNWHRFTMRCLVAGTVLCSIDGGTESSLAVGPDSASIGSLTNHATGDASVAIVSWVGYQCPGTNLTVAGITKSGFTKYNGAWPVEFVGTNPNLAFITGILTSEGTGTITGATASWSNAFAPWFQFGNSSETTPGGKLLVWDYFSFVYNPQLATDFSGTANPTLPRYFDAQT